MAGGGWSKAKHQSVGGGSREGSAKLLVTGGSTLERIQQIELEISRTQKNKATAKHLGESGARSCAISVTPDLLDACFHAKCHVFESESSVSGFTG